MVAAAGKQAADNINKTIVGLMQLRAQLDAQKAQGHLDNASALEQSAVSSGDQLNEGQQYAMRGILDRFRGIT